MILLLLFVTCLVTVTNLMLVIMKGPRGEGAGGHPERGFRGFLWGFLFSVFLNGSVFGVCVCVFLFPLQRSLCVRLWGVCFYFFSGGWFSF